MQIAMFSTKSFDRDYFKRANEKHSFDMQYYEPRLSPQTATLASGSPVVCIFVNDVADAETIEQLAANGTRFIALRCAGFNNVDLQAAADHNILVSRVPAYSPYATAEHTVALMMTLNRRIHKAYNRCREGNFALEGLMGFDFHGKTAGVIGTGKIGALVCKILNGFGCKVLAYDIHENPDVVSVGGTYVSLDQLLAESDIVSLHCPLTPETRYLINDETLAKTKPGVMLVNTGRGGLVDTDAAIRSLKSRHLGYFALDVYEEEEGVFLEDLTATGIDDDKLARLLTFPNVLVTGHQAFFTKEAMTAIAETTLANVARFGRGEECPNRVSAK